MFYEYLNRYNVQKSVLGAKIFKSNIVVPVKQGKRSYRIEENSPVENSMVVGFWITKRGVKVDETYSQITGDVFDSAYLVLRKGSTEVYQKLPLELIRLANEQGRPFHVNLHGEINLSESTIQIPKNDTISADQVIEFQVDYVSHI